MPAAVEWDEAQVLTRVTITESGCWRWLKPQRDGCALVVSHGVCMVAHRFVYQLLVGPIPDGLVLDHLCHNDDPKCPGGVTCPHRACVYPSHLEPVTQAKNSQREKAQRTHCPQGHPYAGWNLILYQGRRYCRACTYRRTNAARRAGR